MKKVLFLVAVLATLASADGFVFGGNLGYADASTTATTAAGSASEDSKATTYGISLGYELGNARFGMYQNSSAVEDSGDARSIGGYADYLIPYTENYKFYIGGQHGIGEQDLSGGASADFEDIGLRGGMLIDFDTEWQLEIGVRHIWRDYDTIVVSGTSVNSETEVLNTYIGLNYKL